MVEIKVGGFYRTRNGKKVGPMRCGVSDAIAGIFICMFVLAILALLVFLPTVGLLFLIGVL